MSHYEDTRPLPATLDELYDQLNAELFGGTLPKIPCNYVTDMRSHGRIRYRGTKTGNWGSRQWHNVVLTDISLLPGMTVRAVRKTMVHEMCHAWELVFLGRGGHDTNWWDAMTRCGYPKDHTFRDAIGPGETDYYSGKQKVKQEKQANTQALRSVGISSGDRVTTPWGQATVKAMTPGKGWKKTRLTLDFDVPIRGRNGPIQFGVIIFADRCKPV